MNSGKREGNIESKGRGLKGKKRKGEESREYRGVMEKEKGLTGKKWRV